MTNSKKAPVIKMKRHLHAVQDKKLSADKKNRTHKPTDYNVRFLYVDKELQEEIKMVKEAMRAIPDIREGKVAAIREAIQRGTYKVHAKKIADKLIRESLLEQIPLNE